MGSFSATLRVTAFSTGIISIWPVVREFIGTGLVVSAGGTRKTVAPGGNHKNYWVRMIAKATAFHETTYTQFPI
ncbi:MAG: hypothetical protein NTV68_13410 [Methanomicrobiales archaeon]|nr:hypothetical protein [Methanomicrobiales archaeon]